MPSRKFETLLGLAVLTADPGSGMTEGDMYWNSTLDVVRAYTGGAWTTVGPSSGGEVSALTILKWSGD